MLQNGSVGAALPGIEIKLLDEFGQEPEGDDPGEIWIRGANMFSGYWPDGDGGPDEDGWWGTGDVGFLDASGDLFLVDRLKELVIVSGFNVYPSEVEDVIREVPSVDDAAVIGVEDPATGEAVVAYVNAVGGEEVPRAVAYAVRQHCAVRLARFKQPSRIVVVDELPLTVTGKVQKGRLRGIERRRSLGLWSDDPTRDPLQPPRLSPVRRRGVVGGAGLRRAGESYVEVSIDDDPDLRRRFGEEVPVTFVDGRQHDFWRVDPARLRSALSLSPGGPPQGVLVSHSVLGLPERGASTEWQMSNPCPAAASSRPGPPHSTSSPPPVRRRSSPPRPRITTG